MKARLGSDRKTGRRFCCGRFTPARRLRKNKR